MKRLEPIDSLAAFVRTYDAGGRFWNLFTQAGDLQISAGEVAKQAGRMRADALAILQMEMHLDGLRPAERDQALQMLDPGMRERREDHEPARTTPSRFVRDAKPGFTAIVTGFAGALVDPKELAARLTVQAPTSRAPLTVPMLAFKRYAVWHLLDRGESARKGILVATEGARRSPPTGFLRVGGIVLEAKSSAHAPVDKCLLAHYYMVADAPK